jgi:tetratricopeptide (TPR) repeat protein
VLNDLGGVFYGTGRLRESLEINAAVLEAFERNGRGGTVGYANVLHNRAVLYYMVGEVVESEAQARLARERVRGFPDLDDTTFAYTHARALSRLGRTSEAVELLRRVVDRADAQNSRFTGSRGRLELGQALLRERRFAEAEERLTAAEAMWTGDPGPNAGNLLLVRVLRAELALEQGQAGAAERWVDQARTAAQAPTARAPVHRFRLNRAAALVALARGDAAAGAAAAGDAAAIAEGVARDPAGSADVGEALLLRARAHLATGDAGAARPQLERAVTSLQRGLGPVHSLTRQARELLATAGPEKGPS